MWWNGNIWAVRSERYFSSIVVLKRTFIVHRPTWGWRLQWTLGVQLPPLAGCEGGDNEKKAGGLCGFVEWLLLIWGDGWLWGGGCGCWSK